MLGQNFSKAFNIKFTDDDGKDKHVWQTCYGPAISRIYAALISMHGDEKGLVLPFAVAPLQVVIVPIVKEETKEKVLVECKKVKELLAKEFSVKLDDSDKTPGFKFNEWEMKGVPVRIEIGMRDLEKGVVTLFRRDTMEKSQVRPDELSESIKTLARKMKKQMKEKADKFFAENSSGSAETMDGLCDKVTNGFVRIPFCTDGLEGKGCADAVKEKCQANIRGSLFGSELKAKGKCIACGKDATIYVYAARQY
jgi:prolyl-tRNA synthetase